MSPWLLISCKVCLGPASASLRVMYLSALFHKVTTGSPLFFWQIRYSALGRIVMGFHRK